jgi:hypothetical protein
MPETAAPFGECETGEPADPVSTGDRTATIRTSGQLDPAADDASRAKLATQGPVLDSIAEDLRLLAVPIAGLRPAPDNARRHADQDVRALMESLRRFGQRKAIVGKHEYRGVSNVVLAGNGTLLAARRLGWTCLAVSWFEGTDDEAQAYGVADNAISELSEWDVAQLASDFDAGLNLGAFFDPDALQDLLGADAPVPDFPSVTQDEQGRLDRIEPVSCPACGHVFQR